MIEDLKDIGKNVLITAATLCGIMFLFAASLGWYMNLITLVTKSEPMGMIAARLAGIFILPLGAILGYF